VEAGLKLLNKYKNTQLAHLHDELFGDAAQAKLGADMAQGHALDPDQAAAAAQAKAEAQFARHGAPGGAPAAAPVPTPKSNVMDALNSLGGKASVYKIAEQTGQTIMEAWNDLQAQVKAGKLEPEGDDFSIIPSDAPSAPAAPSGSAPSTSGHADGQAAPKATLGVVEALTQLGGVAGTMAIAGKAGLDQGTAKTQLEAAKLAGQVQQDGFLWTLAAQTGVGGGIPVEQWNTPGALQPYTAGKDYAGLAQVPPECKGWKSHVLTLTPEMVNAHPALNDWEKGFLKDHLGKGHSSLSTKQYQVVDKIQKKHKAWVMANPGVIPTLFAAKGDLQAALELEAKKGAALNAEVLAQQGNQEWTPPPGMNTGALHGGELFGHQKAGVNWLKAVKRGILALATGLGKTNTVIAAFESLKHEGQAERLGFVVPKGRIVGTVKDIEQLFPGRKIVVLSGASLGKNTVLPANVQVFESSLAGTVPELTAEETLVLNGVKDAAAQKSDEGYKHPISSLVHWAASQKGFSGNVEAVLAALQEKGYVQQAEAAKDYNGKPKFGWKAVNPNPPLAPEIQAAIQDADYVVCGYDPIRKYADFFKGHCDTMVFDECVRLKGKDSAISKEVTEKFASTKHLWYLSATPIPNSPMDLFVLMRGLQPKLFGTLKDYKNAHCKLEFNPHTGGHDITGYKDVQATHGQLAHLIYHRNYESPDVKVVMPKRTYEKQHLVMPPALAKVYQAAEQKILQAVLAAGSENFNPKNALSELLRLEQISLTPRLLDPSYKGPEPKLEQAADIAYTHFAEQAAAGKKPPKGIIFFSHFLETQPFLAEHLQSKAGLAPSEIATIQGSDYRVGGKKVKTIQEVVDAVNAGQCKALIASDAAMEGLNLQYGATKLVHLDTPWRPDALEQREGRIYRPGQTEACQFVHLLMANGIETKKEQTVDTKAAAQSAIIAGDDVEIDTTFGYNDMLEALGAGHLKVAKTKHLSDLEAEYEAMQLEGMQKAVKPQAACGIVAPVLFLVEA
jgi:hypothetical protein